MDKYFVFQDRLGYRIPAKFKDQFYYQNIKKHLTIKSRDYFSKEYITNKYYYETDKALLLPRLFPIKKYIHPESIAPKETYKAKKIKITSKIVPRNELQKDSIEYLMTHPNTLLQLSPGSGKTIITIDVICKLKFKTIIFIHRDALLSQWHDRLISFTDITESQIGVLSSNTYQEVIEKADIILATVQSFNAILRNDKYKIDFLKRMYHSGIGLMVGDEVHTTVGAPMFSIASLLTPCHRTIGLSATPDKNDGTFKIIKYHLGEVYESPFESDTMPAEVHAILFDFDLLKGRERWLFWNGQFQLSRYFQILRKSDRFMIVLGATIEYCINENRHLIVMCERIKLIDELKKQFKDYDCTSFTASEKSDVLNHKIVFTTPGKMRDGIDAPWKDSIILTSPISNIDQAVGRIVRTEKDKKQPIVFDLVDTGIDKISSTFVKNRLPYYKKKKWNILYYTLEGSKVIDISQGKALKLTGAK